MVFELFWIQNVLDPERFWILPAVAQVISVGI